MSDAMPPESKNRGKSAQPGSNRGPKRDAPASGRGRQQRVRGGDEGSGPASQRPIKKKGGGFLRIALVAAIASVSAAIGFGASVAAKPGGLDAYINGSPASSEPVKKGGVSTTIAAVVRALPSVAVLGEKEGPSGTTEVFIQVAGILNMQSVYVLSDNKTVISGVVVEPLSGSGFPGGALERPTGKATVDPSAPRDGVQGMIDALGGARGDEQSRRSQTASIPAPASAPKPRVDQVSTRQGYEVDQHGERIDVPAPSLPSPKASGSSQVYDSSRVPSPQGPATQALTGLSPTVPAPDAANSMRPATNSGAPQEDFVAEFKGGEPLVFDSIDSMVGSASFGQVVRKILDEDRDIDAVRQKGDAGAQQDAYYDLVTRLPAVIQGQGPRHLYVMFDPNCPVCHRYYAEVYQEVQANRVTVHWIPVIVFPDERSSLSVSAALAAEIDNGNDAQEMLHRVMTEQGYIDKLDQSDRVSGLAPYVESVAKNTSVMAMAKAETPLIVFMSNDDQLSISGGIPSPGYIGMIGVDD